MRLICPVEHVKRQLFANLLGVLITCIYIRHATLLTLTCTYTHTRAHAHAHTHHICARTHKCTRAHMRAHQTSLTTPAHTIQIQHVPCICTPIQNTDLLQLVSGPLSQYAAKISLSQSLCGNGAFLVSMMAGILAIIKLILIHHLVFLLDHKIDIPHELQHWGCSGYRKLHFEAGIVGQLLYLEATAIGKGATGIYHPLMLLVVPFSSLPIIRCGSLL
jgi:hypothetical protein